MAKVQVEMAAALHLSRSNFLHENSRFFAQQLAESKEEELKLHAARCFIELGDFVWALETTQKLTSEQGRYLHAVTLLCLGRYKDAESSLLLNASPIKAVNAEFGLYQLGIVYEKKGEWDKAFECFAAAQAINPLIFDAFRRRVLAEKRMSHESFVSSQKYAPLRGQNPLQIPAEGLNFKACGTDNVQHHPTSKGSHETAASYTKSSFSLENLGLVTANSLSISSPSHPSPHLPKFQLDQNITSLSKLPDVLSDLPTPSRAHKIAKNSKENFGFESKAKGAKPQTLHSFLESLQEPVAALLQGNYASAAETFHRDFGSFRQGFYVQTSLGRCAAQNGLYEEAEKHFLKADAAFPRVAEGKEYFSSALWSLGRTQRLVQLSTTLFEQQPYDPRTWIALGNCFSALGDHVSALRFFAKAISLNPRDSYAHCLLAHEQVSLEDLRAAKQGYSRSIELDPLQHSAYWGLGNIALKTEKYTLAIDYFSQALRLNPRLATVQTYLGMAYAGANHAEAAQRHFCAAQELSPGSPINTFHKAWQLYQSQRFAEALREAEGLAGLLGEEPKVFVLLGNIHLALRNFESAHNAYLQALALDPEDSEKQIRHLLDVLNAQMGEAAVAFTPQASSQSLA